MGTSSGLEPALQSLPGRAVESLQHADKLVQDSARAHAGRPLSEALLGTSSDVAFWVLRTASGVLALSHACSAHMTVVALFLGGDLHLDHSHRTHGGGTGWDRTDSDLIAGHH